MRSLLVLTFVALASVSSALTVDRERGGASPKCSSDRSENVPESVLTMCHSSPHNADRCSFWGCLAKAGCTADFTWDYLVSHGCRKERATVVKPKEQSKDEVAAIGSAAPATPVPINPNASTPVASPCGVAVPFGGWTTRDIQLWLLQVAMDLYFDRAQEHYHENPVKRWVGINDKICPPMIPRSSDCSSAVTWIYWTLFGDGPDFINNWSWIDGWTGSLIQQGVNVPGISGNSTDAGLTIGDLCFYYHPMQHVTIYVGGGKVVSHGMDPVGYFPFQYAPLDYCRRYIVGSP